MFDYDTVWGAIVGSRPDQNIVTYPGAFIDWDNSARYKERAIIFTGSNPERFSYWFGMLLSRIASMALPEPFIFVNAWNEWAEGTYFEPDETHGYAYLEKLKQCLDRVGAEDKPH